MTRTRTRTYGVATPSTRQPLLVAMLRAFAWLVSNVVSMLATIFKRPTRDWHTDDAHEDQLPTPGDITQEPFNAGDPGASKALMVSSTRSVRPSNHEGGLTAEHDSLDDLEAELQLRIPRVGVGEERRRRRDLIRGTKSRDASRALTRPPSSWGTRW